MPPRLPRYCRDCGRARMVAEFACPACGGTIYGTSVPGDARPVADAELGPAAALGGPLGRLVSLPPSYVALVYGPHGEGKSSVSMLALPGATYLSSELSPAQVLTYGKRLGSRVADIEAPDWLGRPELPDNDLIVDSINGFGVGLEELIYDLVAAHCQRRNRRAIVVSRVTKDGDPRGSSNVPHLAQVVVEVRDGSIAVLKNRFGPSRGAAFELAAPSSPAKPRYWVVAGRRPRYRLVPWPCPGEPMAAPLVHAAAKRLVLPPPPLAVAAEFSELYAGGWIDPADIEERRAFAAAAGIPFWTPTLPEETPNGNPD